MTNPITDVLKSPAPSPRNVAFTRYADELQGEEAINKL